LPKESKKEPRGEMKERLIARRIEKEALRGNEKALHCPKNRKRSLEGK